MARGLAPLVLAFALLAGTGRAEPAHLTSSLNWVRLPGAESCITSQQLALAVQERVGHRVFAPAARADLSVDGHIAPEDAGFRAVISVTRADGTVVGTRELDAGEDCRELDEGLVAVLVLLIDPDARPAEDEPPKPSPDPAPREPLAWSVAARGLGGLGLLPAPVAGGEIALAVRPRALSLEVALGITTRARAERAEHGASASAWTASLGACHELLSGLAFGFAACAEVLGARLSAEGRDLNAPRSTTAFEASVLASARATLPLSESFSLQAQLGAGLNVLRPRLVANEFDPDTLSVEQRTLWEADPWLALGRVGLTWTF